MKLHCRGLRTEWERMHANFDNFEGRRRDTHIGYMRVEGSLLRVLGEEMGKSIFVDKSGRRE